MNTLQLNTASLNDIVFEGRNQSYGAYMLRRIYNRHLVAGLTTSVALCLLLLGAPLLVQRLRPIAAADTPPLVKVKIDLVDYVQPKAATPPPHAQQQPQKVVVMPPTKVIPQVVKELTVQPKPTVEPTSVVEPELGTLTGPAAVNGSSTGLAGPAGPAASDSGTSAPAPTNAPFLHAEVMPEFAGGNEAMRKFMQRNLRFPRLALANAVSGKVFVAFTVLASGEIADVQVLKGLGYGTDEEAARVVKLMPAWTPGRQNSHPVAVRYTLPITFSYE
jgi:protein TonB